MIGGIAGLTQVTLSGMCQINFFDGYEMTIIAAVVLGGASISGGTGSVIGTFWGVLLMKLISNNLILLEIPAMIATLGASDIILGLAIGITDGLSIKELPSILNYLTNMRILGLIPVTTLVFIICAAILICVLAGINPNGGKGKVGGMILAVIILQVLSSGLSMFHNISDYYKNLIWGIVLIFVMIINVLTERKSRV